MEVQIGAGRSDNSMLLMAAPSHKKVSTSRIPFQLLLEEEAVIVQIEAFLYRMNGGVGPGLVFGGLLLTRSTVLQASAR